MFTNLSGGRLTIAYWVNLYPGNGTWTIRLRNHLFKTIHYEKDLGNIPLFTKYFVDDNRLGLNCGSHTFTWCLEHFYRVLEREKSKPVPIKLKFPTEPEPVSVYTDPPMGVPPGTQASGGEDENGVGFDFQKLLIPAALVAAAYFLLS